MKLLEKPVPSGIYNICSGIPRTIQEILDFLISQSKVSIQIEIDGKRLRPSEVPVFVGSSAKIKQAVQWEPEYKFEDTLIETLNWWRNEVMLSQGYTKSS
jgi:GDP-4-dehydro-6-deoxy-D-mannose reductase